MKKNDPRRKEADKILKESYRLAEKYHLDMDDGGGGDDSKASNAAAKRYLELQYKWADLDDAIRRDARKSASADILKKYGKENVAGWHRASNTQLGVSMVLGILAVGGTLYLGNKAVEGAAQLGANVIAGGVTLAYKGAKGIYNKLK